MTLPGRLSRETYRLLAVAAASAAYYSIYYRYGVSGFDEGYLARTAERILDGQRPYTDFWTVYTPGRFYLTAALFKTFGTSLLVTRYMFLCLKVLTAVLYDALGTRLVGPRYSLVPTALVILVPGAWHAPFLILFFLLFLLPLTSYIGKGGLRWPAVCGLAAGAGFLFRQDLLVYITAAFLGAVVLKAVTLREGARAAVRETGAYFAGMLPAAPVFFYMSGGDPLGALDVMFLKSAAMQKAMNIPFNKVIIGDWPGGVLNVDNLVGLFFYLPPAVYAVCLYVLVSKWRRGAFGRPELAAGAALISALVMFNQALWQANTGHLLKAVPLCFILFAYASKELGRALRFAGLAAGGAFLWIFILSPYGSYFNAGSIGRLRLDYVYYDNPRAQVYVTQEWMPGLVDYITGNTGESGYMMVVPHDSLITFFAGRKNPTRYEFFVPGVLSDEEQEAVLSDALKSELIVYNEPVLYLGYPRRPQHRFSQYCSVLFDGIMEGYGVGYVSGGCVVLVKSGVRDDGTGPFVRGFDALSYGDPSGAVEYLNRVPDTSKAYEWAREYILKAGSVSGTARSGG